VPPGRVRFNLTAESADPRQVRRRRVAAGSAVLVGLLLSGVLIMSRTQAAFTGTTANPASSWQAGTVVLGDDDSGAALFSATGLLPGDTASKCIKVSYTGNLTSTVKLYVTSSSGSLAPYVDLVVEQGTGGGNTGTYAGGCGGFSGTTLYSGTVAGFATASSTFATGVGTFAPSSSGSFEVYKFTYTLDAATPSAQQAQSATATFQWEAQA